MGTNSSFRSVCAAGRVLYTHSPEKITDEGFHKIGPVDAEPSRDLREAHTVGIVKFDTIHLTCPP